MAHDEAEAASAYMYEVNEVSFLKAYLRVHFCFIRGLPDKETLSQLKVDARDREACVLALGP